jgi:hypothetical protein
MKAPLGRDALVDWMLRLLDARAAAAR